MPNFLNYIGGQVQSIAELLPSSTETVTTKTCKLRQVHLTNTSGSAVTVTVTMGMA